MELLLLQQFSSQKLAHMRFLDSFIVASNLGHQFMQKLSWATGEAPIIHIRTYLTTWRYKSICLKGGTTGWQSPKQGKEFHRSESILRKIVGTAALRTG